MARQYKRKNGEEEATPPPQTRPAPKAGFYWRRFPDGSMRAVRHQTKFKGDEDQALADFYGVAPSLPTGSNLRRIESILSEVCASLKLEEASLSPQILASAWREAMGDYIATQAQLVSIERGVATVRCLHPALRFELNSRTRHMIALLNKRFGDGAVRSIRFKL